MKRGIDIKLNLKPILTGFYHDYVFEGPCRMGKGVMLTKEFDLGMIAEGKKKHRDNIQKWLGDWANILPEYNWDRNEEFLLEEQKLTEATEDSNKVDAYIVPDMSRNTDILIAIAEKTQKPIVILPPAISVGATKNAAALHARNLDVIATRSWQELLEELEIRRVRKALANTRVLCAARFGTSMTPSAGDTILDPNLATKRLGIQFAYVNIHELIDQTHIGMADQNFTTPGRTGLNPDQNEAKEIEQIADELIAHATECHMERAEVIHSVRAYYTIKKLLDHYDCNAFTVPCPDICATRRLNNERFTFCMSHSLFNEAGIPSACEYDICSVISLAILENFSHAAAYVGNATHTPCYMQETGKLAQPYFYNLGGNCDTEYLNKVAQDPKNTIFISHAVGNRKLAGFHAELAEYAIRPYTGSGWGVTIRYDFNQDIGTQVTMCRIDPACQKLFVAKGTIVAGRGQDDNGCSLGVFIKVKDGDDFFRKQLYIGNHIPLAYGDYFDQICEFGRQCGFEVITA